MAPVRNGGVLMFAPFCDRHGSKVLLSLDAIDTFVSDGHEMVVTFTCTCGAHGVWKPAVLSRSA